MSDRVTVAQALRLLYASNGLPADGGHSAARWALGLGPLNLRLANFEWRRQALQRHDVHHVLTGYACSPTGEMEIATWEFAGGPFPSLMSMIFCLPLVGIGAVIIPRRSFAAFVRGRRSRTLYATPLTAETMELQVRTLRSRLLPVARPSATLRDVGEYLVLVALSLPLVITPIAIVAALLA